MVNCYPERDFNMEKAVGPDRKACRLNFVLSGVLAVQNSDLIAFDKYFRGVGYG
jgi:hypothetical protein